MPRNTKPSSIWTTRVFSGATVFPIAGGRDDPGFQERLHQRAHPLVLDPPPYPVEEWGMPDLIETGFDIGFQDPVIGSEPGRQVVDLGDRVLRAPVRAKPIRARQEIRLENGFEYQFQTGLDHPICDSGNSKFSELPRRSFRDHHLPHLDRPELARLQRVPDMAQEHLDPDPGLDPDYRGSIDTRSSGPGVAGHPLPRVYQKRRVIDEVVQVTEPAGVVFSRPTMQFGLHPPNRGPGTTRRRYSPARLRTLPSFLAGHAVVLPHVHRLSLARSTTTTPPHPLLRLASYLSPPRSLWPRVKWGTATDGSHVHWCSVDGLGTRLCPCGIATATP